MTERTSSVHAPIWWKRARGVARREADERADLIRLLAMRDALLAVLVLSLALPIVRQFLTPDQRVALTLLVGNYLPLFVLTIIAVVLAVSWSIHGGSMSPLVATYRLVWLLAGIAGGTAVVVALAGMGIIPVQVPASLVGLVGAALVLVLLVQVMARLKR